MKNYKVCKLNNFHVLNIAMWNNCREYQIYDGEKFYGGDFTPIDGFFHHIRDMKSLKTSKIAGLGINKKCNYVLKNEYGKIVAFTEIHVRFGSEPSAYIAGIYTHPKLKGNGYASYLLEQILLEPKKYLSVEPKKIYALVDEDNVKSMKMFESLASLDKRNIGMEYIEISFDLKDFQQRAQNKEFLL